MGQQQRAIQYTWALRGVQLPVVSYLFYLLLREAWHREMRRQQAIPAPAYQHATSLYKEGLQLTRLPRARIVLDSNVVPLRMGYYPPNGIFKVQVRIYG